MLKRAVGMLSDKQRHYWTLHKIALYIYACIIMLLCLVCNDAAVDRMPCAVLQVVARSLCKVWYDAVA
jgi:hypothetical protein